MSIYSHLYSLYQESCSFVITGEKKDVLTFLGDQNVHLEIACKAIVDKTRSISNAVFNIPSESGWYGVTFRKNNLSFKTITETLQDPRCKLNKLEISDENLTFWEFSEMCKSLPESLTHIDIPELILSSETEAQRLETLKQDLTRRKITYTIVGKFDPTYGTTYH